MSLAAMVVWELRLQARTARFRAAVAGYLVLGAIAPAAVVFLVRLFAGFRAAVFLAALLRVRRFAGGTVTTFL